MNPCPHRLSVPASDENRRREGNGDEASSVLDPQIAGFRLLSFA